MLVVFAIVVVTLSIVVPRLTGGGTSPAGAGATGGQTTTTDSTGTGEGSAGAAPPPAATDTTESESGAPPTTRLTEPPGTPTSAPPSDQALDVATRWAQAWVNHPEGISTEEWLEGLRPYTTEEYLVVMSTVDPANIPATEVTGPPEATESYTSSVTVSLPTDGPTLTITVISTPDGWRVARYEQAV